MTCSCTPEQVRSLIRDTLVQYGASSMAAEQESLLIRAGAYCGHMICKDGMRAVWFIEEDQIKVYGRDGQRLVTLAPSDCIASKAA